MLYSMFVRLLKTFESLLELNGWFKVIAFFSIFVTPLYNHMGIILILLMTDLFTSIWSQYRVKKRRCRGNLENVPLERKFNCFVMLYRTIKPERILETVEKIVAYSIVLIVVFIMDYFLIRKGLEADGMFSILSVSNSVFLLIIGAEIFSITRNLGSITNNKVFKTIGNLIKEKTSSKIKITDE